MNFSSIAEKFIVASFSAQFPFVNEICEMSCGCRRKTTQ